MAGWRPLPERASRTQKPIRPGQGVALNGGPGFWFLGPAAPQFYGWEGYRQVRKKCTNIGFGEG